MIKLAKVVLGFELNVNPIPFYKDGSGKQIKCFSCLLPKERAVKIVKIKRNGSPEQSKNEKEGKLRWSKICF